MFSDALAYFLFDQERGTDWGALMAGAVIVLLPTLVLFLVAQRQLVKGTHLQVVHRPHQIQALVKQAFHMFLIQLLFTF